MNRIFALLITMLVAGCAHAAIDEHVADKSYAGVVQRMLVIGVVDRQWNVYASNAFMDALVGDLSRCGVTARVFQPAALELNAQDRLRAMLAAFHPDSVLNMQLTSRTSQRGAAIADTYVIGLFIPSLRREVWKANLELSGGTLSAQRVDAAADLARQVVDQMAGDGVLRTCPPSPHT